MLNCKTQKQKKVTSPAEKRKKKGGNKDGNLPHLSGRDRKKTTVRSSYLKGPEKKGYEFNQHLSGGGKSGKNGGWLNKKKVSRISRGKKRTGASPSTSWTPSLSSPPGD